MIGLAQRSETEDLAGGVAGTLTAASVGGIWVATGPLLVKGILARLGTASGTQATIVDVLKNGVTIFASGKVNFATSSATPTYGPLTLNPTPLAKGDILKVIVTQVGSAPAPVDLALAILFSRTHGGRMPGQMITDGFGQDNER
jgi:hypothetical protein